MTVKKLRKEKQKSRYAKTSNILSALLKKSPMGIKLKISLAVRKSRASALQLLHCQKWQKGKDLGERGYTLEYRIIV